MSILEYDSRMARASTTSDVFNAIAEAGRREILDVLMTGEKAVGAIVDDLSMSQPQVSKHLRVLSDVGLVRCRADGRYRLYCARPPGMPKSSNSTSFSQRNRRRTFSAWQSPPFAT